jgi:hypothetical protein
MFMVVNATVPASVSLNVQIAVPSGDHRRQVQPSAEKSRFSFVPSVRTVKYCSTPSSPTRLNAIVPGGTTLDDGGCAVAVSAAVGAGESDWPEAMGAVDELALGAVPWHPEAAMTAIAVRASPRRANANVIARTPRYRVRRVAANCRTSCFEGGSVALRGRPNGTSLASPSPPAASHLDSLDWYGEA